MQTQSIGDIIRKARETKGLSRNALVHSKKLKGKITGEGLRKIEYGERIPRFPTLRMLADALGMSDSRLKQLEEQALEKQAERFAKKAGREKVTFKVQGRHVNLVGSRTHNAELEKRVRGAVEELIPLIDMYGVLMGDDKEHFRPRARQIILKHFS